MLLYYPFTTNKKRKRKNEKKVPNHITSIAVTRANARHLLLSSATFLPKPLLIKIEKSEVRPQGPSLFPVACDSFDAGEERNASKQAGHFLLPLAPTHVPNFLIHSLCRVMRCNDAEVVKAALVFDFLSVLSK